MSDRSELLDAVPDSLPDGFALFNTSDEVVVWNHAAEAITGYAGMELMKKPVPRVLEGLWTATDRPEELQPESHHLSGRGVFVKVQHKLGHEVPVIMRMLVLRDGLGSRIGTAAVFHPAENLDALPHGYEGEDGRAAASQTDLEDKISIEFEDSKRDGLPFGVLWIGVDQAPDLRKTHGAGACQAMLEKVEHALAQGLRPSEEIGRWGEDEFLVIAHERSAEMLGAQGRMLAGLARTADFRWWGDRISVTVSIGAAQIDSDQDETLAQLLERAREAFQSSMSGGGNALTCAPGGKTCLPS
jgi:diguanylate cyclase (GGDEF)-like protein/PAS domain S-box-containing protein